MLVLLRLGGFLGVGEFYAQSPTPVAQWILSWMQHNAPLPWQNALIATLLVFMQALLVNYIAASQQIIYKESVLPALFFVLLNSMYTPQLMLTPQLMANTFLLLLFFRLCYLYETEKPIFPVLDAGIMLGLGLLFDTDLVIYLPFILVSILYMASFNIRYLLVALLGMVVPVYFLAAILYLNGAQDNLIDVFYYSIDKSYFKPLGITWQKAIVWFILLPVSFASAVQIQINFFRNKVKTRRIQLMTMIMLPFGLFAMLAGDYGFEPGLGYFSLPLSLLLANYYVRNSWKWIKEISLLLLLLCIAYYQYFMST